MSSMVAHICIEKKHPYSILFFVCYCSTNSHVIWWKSLINVHKNHISPSMDGVHLKQVPLLMVRNGSITLFYIWISDEQVFVNRYCNKYMDFGNSVCCDEERKLHYFTILNDTLTSSQCFAIIMILITLSLASMKLFTFCIYNIFKLSTKSLNNRHVHS